MYLKSLYLRNFRNYTDTFITFYPRINVLAGENAQGKTNLLEAIYLLSTGRSFRTNHLSELIQNGKTFFFIKAELIKDGISETLILHYDGTQKKLQYNANLYLSFNNLLGILPSVLHDPSDLKLITGSPSIRRRFLNVHIAQHDPLYVHHLVRFSRALKQRNYLLKSQNISTIDCWESEMASSGAYLTFSRSQMLEEIQKPLKSYAHFLSGEKEEVALLFSPSMRFIPNLKHLRESYLDEMKKNRRKELFMKATYTGPHRDDFILKINAMNAKSYASEGQKRSTIAALRFSEWERLCETSEEAALMCIDDLGVQLDDIRKIFLQKSLDQFMQVFITTPYNISEWKTMKNVRTYTVENGSVFETETFSPS